MDFGIFAIKEINDRNIWESFLLNCKEKTFLSSWNWGDFQKKEGNKIWRLGIYNNEKLVGAALVIKIKAKRGTFIFLPHGPSFMNYELRIMNYGMEILLNKLKELAKEEKASFIRIAPVWQRNEDNIRIFKDLGLKNAPIHMHPELTWELDITLPENEILMNMRKTTRYLIRQAEKNPDIEIIKSKDTNDFKKFNDIYQETVKRHKFTPFSLKYLENQFSSFDYDNQILIFLGKYKGEIISSAIIVFWQSIGFYHHGASSSKYNSNKIPVSYLVQWEAIKEAKKRGCRLYNFWGISPVFVETKKGISNFQYPISNKIPNSKIQIQNKNHPWAGLTIFKTGFGGYSREYVKTQDLILSPKYYFNYIIEKIRKIKRGL